VTQNTFHSVDTPVRGQAATGDVQVRRKRALPPETDNGYDFESLLSGKGNGTEDTPFGPGVPPDVEFTRFQNRLRRGKVKLCTACGGVMNKTSRMILSPLAAILLMIFGGGLVALYGLCIHYWRPAWYITYALPAMYYSGTMFMGVGMLFFFIREKIWYCRKCKEINKR
jgi:hypothetical protein